MGHFENKPHVFKRNAVPLTRQIGGKMELMCPFCRPSHPLLVGVVAPCGTQLTVHAEQTIYRAKFDKEMKCVKCGEGGGRMARIQNAWVHIHDCRPGVAFLTETPPFSKGADIIGRLPEFIRKPIEKLTGTVMTVDEVHEDGTRTGKIIGRFFWKGVKDAQHPQVDPG